MVSHILAAVSLFIANTESAMGYGGIMLLMGIQSCCIPLPSEITMPFAGYLCTTGRFDLWLVALAGATGNLLGAIPAYYLGMCGGRPLLRQYGRYLLISQHDLDRADGWFARRGDITVLICCLLPLVRTFIGFAAGLNRADMRKFIPYTFVGSFLWSLMLAYAGVKVGRNIDVLKPLFHKFDALIGVVIVVVAVLWVWRHVKSGLASPEA